jgi:hypothetical protein
MLPHALKPENFSGYAPGARKLVTDYLAALQRLPLSFLPNLLRAVIEYDLDFPAERKALEKELAYLGSLSPDEVRHGFEAFEQISLSPQLEQFDWINAPGQFVEQLTTYLWETHQLDALTKAITNYGDRLQAAAPPDPPPIPRLGIAVIGQGVASYDRPLFRKLRAHGAYFSRVQPEHGLRLLLDAVAARAKAHPSAYGHWYIDGGQEVEYNPALTCVSYYRLHAARAALLRKIQAETERPGMGPEALRTLMARLGPSDLGMDRMGMDKTGDEVLGRFQVKLLTEGSGTQIFSTTFAQWAAREALRRAQPLTLLVRFAPRQRQKPMNELLSASSTADEPDVTGSLVDADMGSYYNWLNQQRLPGAEKSSFLVWFEDHNEALVIGPYMPRGTESAAVTGVHELLSSIT